MNKLQLTTALAEEADINKSEAGYIVRTFIQDMTDALARGDRVEIRGLFSFYVKKYPSYMGRNPKTGKKIRVKAKKLPYFKPGKELKKRVDQ